MKQDFIRAKELAGQWDITPRRVISFVQME